MRVAETVVEYLKPIQERLNIYLSDPDLILQILTSGSEKLTEPAKETVNEVRKKVGLDVNLDVCSSLNKINVRSYQFYSIK